MRPNISNCHALPGTLVIFEWADGSGKTTQIKALKKLLEKEGREVVVSSWKTAPIIWNFLEQNESHKKVDLRVLPETNLFLQAADLLYRIEREIIPALKKNQIVLLDRGIHTLIVRGLIIGMSDIQLRTGLLWWRNTIYKELFDKAITIHINIDVNESLERLQKRIARERKKEGIPKKKATEGTLLTLHFINTIVYAPDGKKMTRHDKKLFVHKTQEQIINTYREVFKKEDKQGIIEIDGNVSYREIGDHLKLEVVDKIL